MTSNQESPEKPDKLDDSERVTKDDAPDLQDESSEDGGVLLEGEAEDATEELLELEDFSEDSVESEIEVETFPPDELGHQPEQERVMQTLPPPEPQQASAIPLVLGGIVAGVIGFGAAFLLNPNLRGQSDNMTRVLESVDGNAAALASLTSEVEALEASIPEVPETSGLESSIAALDASVADISTKLSGISQTLSDAEARAAAGFSDLTSEVAGLRERIATLEVDSGNVNSAQGDAAAEQLSSFQAELESLVSEAETRIVAAEEKAQAILAEAQAAAEATEADAALRAELARKQAALAELKTAVDAGASYTDIVAAFDNVPTELAQHADSGVPTMVALQQAFPPAARSALATAQTVPEDASTGERFTAFLRRQTNARSLAPKDGNDPDAVLSRAEAFLSEGKLNETLTEVSALPEEARAAMSGWLVDAQTRQAALQAVDALSANLN